MKDLTLKEMGLYLMMGAILGLELMGMMALLTGCTDKITYKHTQEPNEITVKYNEGMGNSTKSGVTVVLSDGTRLEIGNSTTDQEEVFKALERITDLVEKLSIRYGTGL